MSFYMIAGTLSWEQGADALCEALVASGWSARNEDGDVQLDSPASLALREGFSHEFIIVGDAAELAVLEQEVERLAASLDARGIGYHWELYDPDNRLIGERHSA
jgi:hypothetical protein